MSRFLAGLVFVLFTTSAMGDIWDSLFKEKLAEASNGNAEAQYDVGTMYQNGRGVKADRDKAIAWYRKAAAQGESKSISRLQLMQANATRFEKTASEAKDGNADSQYDLGNMHMKGVGTNIDYRQAVKTFEQSASQGHIKSAYKLGLIYYEGNDIKRDGKKAYKWFRQAAENGYPAAQYYLGKLFADGTGVRKDLAESLVWLGKAVDGGFDQARGEMIAVSESIKAASSVKEQAVVEPAEKFRKPPRSKAIAHKPAPGALPLAETRPIEKKFSLEDVVLAAWSRDGEPVTWLPSKISNCRTENEKISCFSDDQTRNSGQGLIKYKTKAIISNFSSDGSFDVTYRNLVVSAAKAAVTESGNASDADEVGGLGDEQTQSYQVKTGWSTPHTLECKMKNHGTVSCVKNNTHTIVLTSPAAITAGK